MRENLKLLFFLICSALFFFSGCSPQAKTGAPKTLADKPLAAFQGELLDLAFETATAIPVDPHIKDRARTQENVVAVSLRLDQPQRALKYIEGIENWRRGAAYGDLAFYKAKHGDVAGVHQDLNIAGQIAEFAEDWRKDTIKVKMARAYALLGQTQQADEFGKGVVEFESGKVDQVKAMTADKNSFDDQIKSLDELVALGHFDITKNALEAYAELFNRFYGDPQRRSQAEEKIKMSWNKLPLFMRIDLLMAMAGFALDHADQVKALALTNEAQLLADGAEWPLEYHIPMVAKLDLLRFRCGEQQKARASADALLSLFNAEGKKIVNIDRAGVLRPLAETYQSMGDRAAALAVYKLALAEGVENPNSRPRAEDLSATLISMALHGVEPDDELWTRIRQIKDGLADPW
jgi:hypothetical protein